ncbi:helix-turn-helix transcriptional regulator [Rhodobacteraceae bacterium HSP-20]|uniref:Helix-turn-helix transcriptional regulator n=1 Tax=Paragemmobacter amnigenus TaxID=2852097 RepID=A0ABS6J1P9_9RHOB|nr:helix-turn-helix transcriptional regulator [Rhodobacter amnigenus]MBU9697689.1 helix-turn-helix transcriptional regulator [Rhodobacter amnigenus]MBV4388916.1 helix-turn-helix transcriptional regulator [Rhodobacter amnigenus]
MDWHEASARVIDALHGADFAPALVSALRTVAPFEHSVTFAYRGDQRPLALHDEFPEWKRKVMVADYQAGPYLLDPFYLNATTGPLPRLVRLRDLAPDRFYQGEYFRNYYIRTELAEEIGFMVDAGQGVSVVLSAMRSSRAFSAREFRDLAAVLPFVAAAIRHNWSDLARRFGDGPSGGNAPALTSLIDRAFRSVGRNLLTARETEVVEYTLRGHSAEATGQALGISPGTVRIHKRNIYTKLGIGSQGELFSRFIATLSSLRD